MWESLNRRLERCQNEINAKNLQVQRRSEYGRECVIVTIKGKMQTQNYSAEPTVKRKQ